MYAYQPILTLKWMDVIWLCASAISVPCFKLNGFVTPAAKAEHHSKMNSDPKRWRRGTTQKLSLMQCFTIATDRSKMALHYRGINDLIHKLGMKQNRINKQREMKADHRSGWCENKRRMLNQWELHLDLQGWQLPYLGVKHVPWVC